MDKKSLQSHSQDLTPFKLQVIGVAIFQEDTEPGNPPIILLLKRSSHETASQSLETLQ